MTDERVEAIRKRVEKATKGPWSLEDSDNPHGITAGRDSDGAFIYVAFPEHDKDLPFLLNSRADIEYLLSKVDAAERLVGELNGRIKEAILDCEDHLHMNGDPFVLDLVNKLVGGAKLIRVEIRELLRRHGGGRKG